MRSAGAGAAGGAVATAPVAARILVEIDAPPGGVAARAPRGLAPGRAGDRPRGAPRPRFDQRGRCVRLGADRRYTGPDCPPEMLDVGGDPQGDYVPVPWLLPRRAGPSGRDRGPGRGAGPARRPHSISHLGRRRARFRLHLFCGPSPAARLRAYLQLTGGSPRCFPSGPTGTGRAATSTSTSATSRTTGAATANTSSRSTRS